jgi:hypothetical protein
MRSILDFVARLPALAVAAAAMLPAPAVAAVGAAEGRAAVLEPLSLLNVEELSFGNLFSGPSAGTVVIDPNDGSRTVTGGVVPLGGVFHPARFLGAGAPNTNVAIVREPRGSITLTRISGTETMTVDDFTVDGDGKPRALGQQSQFEFFIGGRLNVGANQAQGTYVGTFEVIVDYR